MNPVWWILTLPFTVKFWLLLLVGFNLPAYLIHQLLLGYFFKDRDLKRRYNAKWGLVTGASSGMHSDKLIVIERNVCWFKQGRDWQESARRWL